MTTDPIPEFSPPPTILQVPELALVALVGASSAGKSRFAARHFAPSEVLSSDVFRAMVSDDATSLDANADALESLLFVAGKRLKRGRLTVVDAINVRPDDRRKLVDLARAHDVPPVAIVLDLPRPVLEARHAARADRNTAEHIAAQVSELRRTLHGLDKEGFRQVWVLRSEAEVNAITLRRVPLPGSRRELHGPFDLIGDVHGCLPELRDLLTRLGYMPRDDWNWTPPRGRTAVFVGDLVDRGPDSVGVLRTVMAMVASGAALCVPGNHDEKLKRALDGKAVKALHGLDVTLAALDAAGEEFRAEVRRFLEGLVSHLVLDGGRLVVAHAGLPEAYQGRTSGRVRGFALYGDVDGSKDELGLPVRRDWAREYTGKALVVYGHTPVARPVWVNRTLDIDTGCAFGGHLTALRYPEQELVSVPAQAQYAVPPRPLTDPEPQAQAALDLATFGQTGRIQTRTFGGILLKGPERRAAVEAWSRLGIEPGWGVYLPPTVSPVEPSRQPDLLEDPEGAWSYYRAQGIGTVICREHRGRRAVVVLARTAEAAERVFGMPGQQGHSGRIYTRSGQVWGEEGLAAEVLRRVHGAAERAHLWDTLHSDWAVLDAQLLPWPDTGALIPGPDDVQLRPVHLLASEGQVHTGRDHLWHLHTLGTLADADPRLFGRTAHRVVNLSDAAQLADAEAWWTALTAAGAEGMVVGPVAFLPTGAAGQAQPLSLQPALTVRGRDSLRRIYGPEEAHPENLSRLRARALGAQRARAVREFHLGLESLARLVEGAGTVAVHECVLGVLALDSEATDAQR